LTTRGARSLAHRRARGYIKLEFGYQRMHMSKTDAKGSRVRFGRFSVGLPGTRGQRTVLGAGLCAGGVVGFLPVVGFWMLPLGILVLSVDHAPVRRLRRRVVVTWVRRRRARAAKPA
jgi:hypothetical protein